MKKSLLSLSVLMFGMFSAPSAHAIKLVLSNVDCSPFGSAAQCQAAQDAVSNVFGAGFGDDMLTDFLKASGTANATSTRSNFAPGMIGDKKLWAGISLAAALQVPASGSSSSGAQTNRLPAVGLGAQSFLTVGLSGELLHTSFGLPVDPKRISVAASFGTFSTTISKVDYKFTSFGLGASYQLHQEVGWNPVMSWQGVRLTSGLVFSSTSLKYATPIKISTTTGGQSLDWNSNLDITLKSSVLTVPVDIVTGIKLLWFLNLYTGLGVDFNFIGSKTEGGVSGPISNTTAATTFATATVDGTSETQSPTIVQLRYLLGTQFDLGPVAWHIQASYSNPRVIAVNTGLLFQL